MRSHDFRIAQASIRIDAIWFALACFVCCVRLCYATIGEVKMENEARFLLSHLFLATGTFLRASKMFSKLADCKRQNSAIEARAKEA